MASSKISKLTDMAHQLRIHSVEMTLASGSGHPTSCSSIAEIMSVLFFDEMKYLVESPRDPASDRLVLSKGHAAPILYAAWSEAGLFPKGELMNLRKFTSILEGHPVPRRQSFVDVATGSLGQGLSVASGMAYSGLYLEELTGSGKCAKVQPSPSFRVYCLLGDGEVCEGSVWEAAHFASHYKLHNLVAIVDCNRLGQSGPTSLQHNMELYKKRWDSFGWNSLIVDGHSVQALLSAFQAARAHISGPTVILAKTFKGRNFIDVEDRDNWHGKPLTKDIAAKSIEAIRVEMTTQNVSGVSDFPNRSLPPHTSTFTYTISPSLREQCIAYVQNMKSQFSESAPTDKIATRAAYGNALVSLGNSVSRIIVLDADVSNSSFSEKFKFTQPSRYVECYIAEQNLVGIGSGIACRDRHVVFISTFAAFLSRAYDQLRMCAISGSQINLVGSHAGCSIGQDGASQMALEDLGMFRSLPECVVFYPSDAVSLEYAVALAATVPAMTYIRTSRPATQVLYRNGGYAVGHKFEIGKAIIVVSSARDQLLIVTAGVIVTEAVQAAEILAAKHSVYVRIIDPFTIKPIDGETILRNAKECGNKVLTLEDHYAEGGVGESVASVLASDPTGFQLHRVHVTGIPRSGEPTELLDYFGLSAERIVKKVLQIVSH